MTDSYTEQTPASTAAEESKHVAGVAQGEAKRVAGEATAQARSLVGEAKTQVTDQVGEQSRQQRDRLVDTLGTLSSDLEQMADRSDGGGLAADVAREFAGHTRNLGSYLDGREPGQMLDDTRSFARRRPGLFLIGALAAGIVAGRLARGVKDADDAPTQSASTSGPIAPPLTPPSTYPSEPFGTPPQYAPPVSATPPVPTSPVEPALGSPMRVPDAGPTPDLDGYDDRPGSPGTL